MIKVEEIDIFLTVLIAFCVFLGIQIGLFMAGCNGGLPSDVDPPPEPKGVTETDYIIGLPDDVVIMTEDYIVEIDKELINGTDGDVLLIHGDSTSDNDNIRGIKFQ